MELALAPRSSWKSRGAPRREIPEEVRTVVDSTYRTKDLAEIRGIVTTADHAEARAFVSLARSYARYQGRKLRVQPYIWEREPDSPEALAVETVRFIMVDIPKGTK